MNDLEQYFPLEKQSLKEPKRKMNNDRISKLLISKKYLENKAWSEQTHIISSQSTDLFQVFCSAPPPPVSLQVM